jgi:hypothetical protein
MLAHVVVLVVSALAAPGAPSGAAISTYFAPVDEDVLGEEFSAAKVEATLRDRLKRRTALRLVDEPEPGAMRVQVTGCARVRQSTVKQDRQRHPPVTLPKGGTTLIREEEHGASVENRTFVVLSVRVVWQDETRELASGEADLSLEDAASMVAREIERLAKRKAPRSTP